MIGKDYWENMEIDATSEWQNIEFHAKQLIDKFGPEITEADLLKMNAFSDSMHDPIQTALVRASLEYYKTLDYNPEWIHNNMDTEKKNENFLKKVKKTVYNVLKL